MDLIERAARRNEVITESLARATNTPIDEVTEIYASESAELEKTSRVKSFIGIIATRRTRTILRKRSRRHPQTA